MINTKVFLNQLVSQKIIWAATEVAYIVAVGLYCFYEIPQFFLPLVSLASKGYSSKLVIQTPSFHVYSNSAGYQVGRFTRGLICLFLFVFGLAPIVIAFVVTPIFSALTVYTLLFARQEDDRFSILKLIPTFLFHPIDTQPEFIDVNYHTPFDNYQTLSNIKYDDTLIFEIAKWQIVAGLIMWIIHLLQIMVARLGFFSELSVSKDWLMARQSCYNEPNSKITPYLKSMVLTTISTFVACLFYFISTCCYTPFYYYSFHITTYLTALFLTFTIYASFASVFELREFTDGFENSLVNHLAGPEVFNYDECAEYKLKKRPDTSISVSSNDTLSTKVYSWADSNEHTHYKNNYCGFMSLEAGFLVNEFNLFSTAAGWDDQCTSSMLNIIKRFWASFVLKFLAVFQTQRGEQTSFSREFRIQYNSQVWVDEGWIREVGKMLNGNLNSMFDNHDGGNGSLLPLYSHSPRLEKGSSRLQLFDSLSHNMLLVAFRNDALMIAMNEKGHKYGFRGSSDLSELIKNEILYAIMGGKYANDDLYEDQNFTRPTTGTTLTDF